MKSPGPKEAGAVDEDEYVTLERRRCDSHIDDGRRRSTPLFAVSVKLRVTEAAPASRVGAVNVVRWWVPTV
jgi:hypothetical protein